MKYQINDETNTFEISEYEVRENTKTRTHIAISLFYVCVGFLVFSALYGFKAGNFNALQTIFENIKIPIGTLLGYYFGSKNG